MTYTCLKDPTHLSDDPDYCSVCGAKIVGNASHSSPDPSLISTGAAGPTETDCPDCGTPRVGGAKFCEVCRHDFGTGTSGNVAIANVTIADAVPAPPRVNLSPEPLPVSVLRLEAVVVTDMTLYTDPDPSITLPTNTTVRTFPLDLAENLIGRRSDKRDIHPEIPLIDPGISHRHAKFVRDNDGSWALLDVGSANGTQLNGVEVPAGVRSGVKAGDEITLGCWTRITLREIGGTT